MKFCTCSPLNCAMRLVGVKSLAQLRRKKKKSIHLCLARARKLLCNCIAKVALFVQCVSPLTLPLPFPFYTLARTHSCHWPKLNGPSAGPSLPSILFHPAHQGWSQVPALLCSVADCCGLCHPRSAEVCAERKSPRCQSDDGATTVVSRGFGWNAGGAEHNQQRCVPFFILF